MALILQKEEWRPVAPGKEDVHYPDFATICALLNHLGLSDELFTSEVTTIYEAVRRGDALLAELVAKLTTQDVNEPTRSLLDDCYAYLSEADDPKPSDLIFVFGGKTAARPERAAQLYHNALSAHILMSGGNAIYAQDQSLKEAAIYRDLAITAGVPHDAIILEDRSITVPDNIRVSLNMLDASGQSFSSIILVNSPYTQRRGWSIFKKHLPDSVQLYRVNCTTKLEFAPGNWYHQENTLRVVLNEFMKMRASVVHNTA